MGEHGVQFCMNTESAFVFLSMPVCVWDISL